MMGTPGEARREPNPLLRWSGFGVLLFAGIAAGHAVWALYGSGDAMASLDVMGAVSGSAPGPPARGSVAAPTCPTFGPVVLTPQMNPVRAVLATGYAPMGVARTRYEIAMLDDQGQTLWDRHGTIGGREEDASFVTNATRILDFEIPRRGAYSFVVSFPEGSMDDLREARIELRHGVTHVDGRITWGFGIAAFACLLINVLSPKSESYTNPNPLAREDYREAA